MLESMRLVCELLSPEGDGSIPMELFFEIYEYLCKVDGTISAKTIQAVRDYLDQFTYVPTTTWTPLPMVMGDVSNATIRLSLSHAPAQKRCISGNGSLIGNPMRDVIRCVLSVLWMTSCCPIIGSVAV